MGELEQMEELTKKYLNKRMKDFKRRQDMALPPLPPDFGGYSGLSPYNGVSKEQDKDRPTKNAVKIFETGQVASDMETFMVALRTNNKAMLLMISKWESETDESKNYFARLAKREIGREGV